MTWVYLIIGVLIVAASVVYALRRGLQDHQARFLPDDDDPSY